MYSHNSFDETRQSYPRFQSHRKYVTVNDCYGASGANKMLIMRGLSGEENLFAGRVTGCYAYPVIAYEHNTELQLSARQISDHVDSVLASPAFASSKRCQDFLRHIVHEAMEGRSEEITERTIAHTVFGKSQRFEPSEDSLVRVKALEVRRRLAQYYRDNPDSDVKISLPSGGYVPQFLAAVPEQTVPEQTVPENRETAPLPSIKTFSRRKAVGLLGGVAAGVAALFGVGYEWNRHTPTPIEQLWKPIALAKKPLLISIPILTSKTANGSIADRVGIGVAAAISMAADFLNSHGMPYRLRFGPALTFVELREQPSLLLGGFTSTWGMWVTKRLRYNLVTGETWADSYIQDSLSPKKWQAENLQPDGYATVDHAIVARLFDAFTGEIVFIAAGITTFGTEGAASVLFDPHLFGTLIADAPSDWESKSFEAIVRVSIVGTTPSSLEVVAKHFW